MNSSLNSASAPLSASAAPVSAQPFLESATANVSIPVAATKPSQQAQRPMKKPRAKSTPTAPQPAR